MTMTFDTKIAIVLRDDLEVWQKLNVTAFLVSGITGTVEGITGENYEDASGNIYLPMCIQPMMVFEAAPDKIQNVYNRAMSREVLFSIFTEELFQTGNDIDNRAAIKAVAQEDLKIAGMAFRDQKKTVDKVLKGVSLHR